MEDSIVALSEKCHQVIGIKYQNIANLLFYAKGIVNSDIVFPNQTVNKTFNFEVLRGLRNNV